MARESRDAETEERSARKLADPSSAEDEGKGGDRYRKLLNTSLTDAYKRLRDTVREGRRIMFSNAELGLFRVCEKDMIG